MKIGFIGTGSMGGGMIRGIVGSNFTSSENINIFDPDRKKVEDLVKEYNVTRLNSELEITEKSDIVILAVKPGTISAVLEKIKQCIGGDTIILTVAAGINIKSIENIIGKEKKIVRAMPNTPAQIMQGMTAVSFNKNIDSDEKDIIFDLLNSFGKSEEINEELMHAYTGISGSLPAYVYIFMEALADGGVLEGMPRDKAYRIIAQTVKGSAEMLLSTGKHPGQLKDEVTSPGGTTIEALKTLEKGNFRGTLIDAVIACTEKSKKMAEKK